MRLIAITLFALSAFGATPKRPSYLGNRHSSNLTWQTRATTFTGVNCTKTGTATHWDFGDGTSQNAVDPTKVYPDTSLKTVRMISTDGWSGLTLLYLYNKSMRGRISSLAECVNLAGLYLNSNGFVDAMPALTENTKLVTIAVGYNYSGITGSIPALSNFPDLQTFNSEYTYLTGTIPSLASNPALVTFIVQVAYLEGTIPSLTANVALETFATAYDGFTGWAGGIGSRVLTNFNVYNNVLPASAINQILADLVVAQAGGNPICSVVLQLNAAPTGQGLTDLATLRAAGWTVTVDEE